MASTFYAAVSEYGPALALLLQALVISRFLNPKNRDYPLAIVFTLFLFLLTSAAYFLDYYKELLPRAANSTPEQTFLLAYSIGDLCMHVLLLALMLQLLRRSLKSLNLETRIIIPLASISALVALTAYNYFSGGPSPTKTIVQTRQVVSFWLVLINLYWWTLLLRRRQIDRRILLLSAGIGLMMTGQVIGDGIFSFAGRRTWLSLLSILIMYGTHFACLYTWFNAFRPSYALAPAPKLDESLT